MKTTLFLACVGVAVLGITLWPGTSSRGACGLAATRVKIIKAVSGVAPGSHSRALAESL